MKIALIGPGIICIPPTGWGAVEILIWDYYNELTSLGHNVIIINKIRNDPRDQNNPQTNYCRNLIQEINNGIFDFVHIHYDVLFHIVPFLTTKVIGITSHYPYIDNLAKHNADNFNSIFQFMIKNTGIYNNSLVINFVLADKDSTFLIKMGANPNYIYKLENGVASDKFIYKSVDDAIHIDKTIYLGKITSRKGQSKYCNLENIHIVGPEGDALANYQGTWTRHQIYNNLCDYGNLLLLSNGEADPLVVKEAMMAGLGVVINETSSKNIIKNHEFISVIPDALCDDLNYIQCTIDNNRKISYQKRDEIIQYAREHFSWESLMPNYINFITNQIMQYIK